MQCIRKTELIGILYSIMHSQSSNQEKIKPFYFLHIFFKILPKQVSIHLLLFFFSFLVELPT